MSYTVERDWVTGAGLRAVVLLVDLTDGRRMPGGASPRASPLLQTSHRCGYVMVTPGSGLWGSEYGEVYDVLGAHGDLTYSSNAGGEDYPARSEDGWWVGFDCGHAGDTVERWTLEAVAGECEDLARQVASKEPEMQERMVRRRLREL